MPHGDDTDGDSNDTDDDSKEECVWVAVRVGDDDGVPRRVAVACGPRGGVRALRSTCAALLHTSNVVLVARGRVVADSDDLCTLAAGSDAIPRVVVLAHAALDPRGVVIVRNTRGNHSSSTDINIDIRTNIPTSEARTTSPPRDVPRCHSTSTSSTLPAALLTNQTAGATALTPPTASLRVFQQKEAVGKPYQVLAEALGSQQPPPAPRLAHAPPHTSHTPTTHETPARRRSCSRTTHSSAMAVLRPVAAPQAPPLGPPHAPPHAAVVVRNGQPFLVEFLGDRVPPQQLQQLQQQQQQQQQQPRPVGQTQAPPTAGPVDAATAARRQHQQLVARRLLQRQLLHPDNITSDTTNDVGTNAADHLTALENAADLLRDTVFSQQQQQHQQQHQQQVEVRPLPPVQAQSFTDRIRNALAHNNNLQLQVLQQQQQQQQQQAQAPQQQQQQQQQQQVGGGFGLGVAIDYVREVLGNPDVTSFVSVLLKIGVLLYLFGPQSSVGLGLAFAGTVFIYLYFYIMQSDELRQWFFDRINDFNNLFNEDENDQRLQQHQRVAQGTLGNNQNNLRVGATVAAATNPENSPSDDDVTVKENGLGVALCEKTTDNDVTRLYKRLLNGEPVIIPTLSSLSSSVTTNQHDGNDEEKDDDESEEKANDSTIPLKLSDFFPNSNVVPSVDAVSSSSPGNEDNTTFLGEPSQQALVRSCKFLAELDSRYPGLGFTGESIGSLLDKSFVSPIKAIMEKRVNSVRNTQIGNATAAAPAEAAVFGGGSLWRRLVLETIGSILHIVLITVILGPLSFIHGIPQVLASNESARYYGEVIWQFFASLVPEVPAQEIE